MHVLVLPVVLPTERVAIWKVEKLPGFWRNQGVARSAGGDSDCVSSRRSQNKVEWQRDLLGRRR